MFSSIVVWLLVVLSFGEFSTTVCCCYYVCIRSTKLYFHFGDQAVLVCGVWKKSNGLCLPKFGGFCIDFGK